MNIDENKIRQVVEGGYEKAKQIIADADKFEELLKKFEEKLKTVPAVGEKLSEIPVVISLLRMYLIKEYTAVPASSVIAMVSGILYFLSPVDLIPDAIPVIGFADDVLVVSFVLKFVEADLAAYRQWRIDNNK